MIKWFDDLAPAVAQGTLRLGEAEDEFQPQRQAGDDAVDVADPSPVCARSRRAIAHPADTGGPQASQRGTRRLTDCDR